MRMIDADALKEKAFGKRSGLIHTSDIDAMPTIEPKKGWFVKMSDADGIYYCCSECGEELHRTERFCHCCGADVRGERP